MWRMTSCNLQGQACSPDIFSSIHPSLFAQKFQHETLRLNISSSCTNCSNGTDTAFHRTYSLRMYCTVDRDQELWCLQRANDVTCARRASGQTADTMHHAYAAASGGRTSRPLSSTCDVISKIQLCEWRVFKLEEQFRKKISFRSVLKRWSPRNFLKRVASITARIRTRWVAIRDVSRLIMHRTIGLTALSDS